MSEKVNKKTEQLMLQPNMWMERWKVNNQSVRFFNMNWEEKIASQLCDGIKEDVKRLPNFCKTEENQDWLDLKMAASKEAILKTVQWMENTKSSDDEDESFDSMHNSDDDDDPFMEHKKDEHPQNHNKKMVSKEDVCYLLYQLQYNVVFDMGFKIKIGVDNGKKDVFVHVVLL
jgi:hypothetical protein